MSDSVTQYYDAHVRHKLRDFVDGNERIERAWQTIEEWAPASPSHILEMGCGIGAVCWRMSRKWPEAKVVGLDLSARSIQVARKLFGCNRVSFIEAMSGEGCGNQQADLIVLMDVYEHISPDERLALHERLKNSRSEYGKLFLSFPTPRYLAWLRKYKPDAIQPIDEDIDFDTISALARGCGTEVLLYKEVNVWHEADYAHAVLGNRDVWKPPAESSPSPVSNRFSRPTETLLPTRSERARMVHARVGSEFVPTPYHSGSVATDSAYINPQWSIKSLDTVVARRAILDSLRTEVPRLSGVLLDVGCGHKPYKSLILSQACVTHYIGLDIGNNAYAKPDLQWDGKQMPLRDNSVNCALATEVLEHCPQPGVVLRETFRALKPGGLFFFTVPFLWPLHDTPGDEYRFTPFSLERSLFDTGFVDVKLKALGGWDASLAQLTGLWVRRRPMSSIKRAIVSRFALPIVRALSHRDQPPKEFGDNCMITGLSGTACKPL